MHTVTRVSRNLVLVESVNTEMQTFRSVIVLLKHQSSRNMDIRDQKYVATLSCLTYYNSLFMTFKEGLGGSSLLFDLQIDFIKMTIGIPRKEYQ